MKKAILTDCRELTIARTIGREEMKEVFFIRHGKTSENMANILIGQNDYPLSDEARRDIKSLRHSVVHPDKVFSSDLKRASITIK